MWSMMLSVPASAENCGSKLISALEKATRSVFAGSAAAAHAEYEPSAKMIAAIAQCLARGMRALRIGWRIERGSVTMNVSPTSTIAEVPDRQRELARLRGNRGIATWTRIGARNSRVSLRFGSNPFDAKRNLDPRTPGSTLAAARLKPVPPDPPDSLLQALL